MLSFAGGTWTSVDKLFEAYLAAQANAQIEGLTLLGGEPFAHAAGAAELAARVQSVGGGVMIFSGYYLTDLQASPDPAVQRLLAHTDLLVDGPYERDLPETRRRWIGSRNQQIHFLSDRYAADDPAWQVPNTLEIRFAAGELTVNGFPAAGAREFWQRLPQQVKAQ
jgi:anaerobic ribonucleoside-triphosphate reductase activating protein